MSEEHSETATNRRGGRDGGRQDASKDQREPASLFPPHLREEFETLRKAERKIIRALEDPEAARRFADDPARALQQFGVDVPPLLKGHLVANRPTMSLHNDRKFRLPNGQVVTAHVKVRFTRGKGGSDAR